MTMLTSENGMRRALVDDRLILCLRGGGLPGIAIDRRAVRLPGQREPAFSESARASIIASAATIASARPAGGEPWLW
jgi:hypothetical protein